MYRLVPGTCHAISYPVAVCSAPIALQDPRSLCATGEPRYVSSGPAAPPVLLKKKLLPTWVRLVEPYDSIIVVGTEVPITVSPFRSCWKLASYEATQVPLPCN